MYLDATIPRFSPFCANLARRPNGQAMPVQYFAFGILDKSKRAVLKASVRRADAVLATGFDS